MQLVSKTSTALLILALLFTPPQGYALEYKSTLRPLSTQLTEGQPLLKVRLQKKSLVSIDTHASAKRINELLWEWNFRIYALSHRRMYLRSQGREIHGVLLGIAAVARGIEKKIPFFRGMVSDRSIAKLQRAVELLRQRKKGRKDIPAPNESAANMLLTSIMLEVSRSRRELLQQRLLFELSQPRVYFRDGNWYVREQHYIYSEEWQTSALSYTYRRYDTVWEALRALDHQIDTELKERKWLLECVKLIDRVITGPEVLGGAEKAALKQDIDSMLLRLKRVIVEDKRLARILLRTTAMLLDSDRVKQAEGLLRMTKGLFIQRISEIEEIVKGLTVKRLPVLRAEVKEKNEYLMGKVTKILHDLNTFHYGLTRRIINEDLLGGQGLRYLKEPDMVAFLEGLKVISRRLNRTEKVLDRENIEAVKRFFILFRDRVIASKLLAKFMTDYRDEYIKTTLIPDGGGLSREDIFQQTFQRYSNEHRAVSANPELYSKMFFQAAFVSPKIRRRNATKDNPEFLRLSNAIMRQQAQRVGIRPEGLRLLLRQEEEIPASGPLAPDVPIKVGIAIGLAA